MTRKLFRNIIIALATIVFTASVFNLITPQDASSAAGDECKLFSNGKDIDDSFLAFPTWYRGLNGRENDKGECSLQDTEPNILVFTVALNIGDIVLRAMAIFAVLFVIYGGFLLITAQGASDKIKNGKLAITQALIGLTIAILASSVVGFIVETMHGGTVNSMGLPKISANQFLNNVLNLIYFACGTIAVIIIILSGYRYSTAAGNPDNTKKATQTIVWSCVGLAAVVLAWTVTYFLLGRFI